MAIILYTCIFAGMIGRSSSKCIIAYIKIQIFRTEEPRACVGRIKNIYLKSTEKKKDAVRPASCSGPARLKRIKRFVFAPDVV
jgi:hypothetical protein